MWPGRPSSEAPPHLALREERAGAGGLLHADSLGRALELVLAPVRAEEVAALLVLTARHALAALDAHAADGVVRLPRNLLPLARIHRRPPGSPVFGCATEAPPRLGCRARCAIGFLPWVRAFPPRVAVRSRLAGVLTTRGAWGAFSSCARRWACARSRSPAPSSSAQVVCAERNRRPMPAGMCNGGAKAFAAAARPAARMPRKGRRIVLPNAPHRTPEDLELGRIHPRPEAHAFLRRADCPGHRPRGGAVRLGAQPARPRRSGVHRPARPRRPHPGGLRGGRRQGAAGARS